MTKGKIKSRAPTAGPRLGLRQHEPVDWMGYPAAFSFQHMVVGYSVANCDQAEKAALAEAMWRRSQLSWRDLRSAQRHGLGPEKIERISRERPSVVTNDVTLIAFRFSGLKAMVGFQEGRIFNVVWLDHDFTVYQH